MTKNNRTRRKLHCYTAEQIAWLREWYPKMTANPLTILFNKTFNASVTNGAMKATLLRYKIICGRTGQFKKGIIPYNKGKTGINVSPATEFKKGHVPYNTKPVGTNCWHTDGYLWVKIAEPNVWRQKHVLLWEQHNGPRPPGHTVIFADQDRTNITIDNLLLSERKLLLRMNKNHYAKTPGPIKPSIIALSSVEIKLQRLKTGTTMRDITRKHNGH